MHSHEETLEKKTLFNKDRQAHVSLVGSTSIYCHRMVVNLDVKKSKWAVE